MREYPKTTESMGGQTTDRRTFLQKAGSLIGVGLGAYFAGLPAAFGARVDRTGATGPSRRPLGGAVVSLPARRTTLLDALNREAFAAQLNTGFILRASDGPVDLHLVEAKDLLAVKPGREGMRDSFSLVFRGSANRLLEQGTYPVKHGRLGEFDLFIVPIREEGYSRFYQAIFNRIA